jgi:hypothetical protein
MFRYERVTDSILRDTETNHRLMLWDMDQHAFLDMAEDVQAGLNLVLATRLRRGSKKFSKLEFEALRAGFVQLKAQNPDNILIRDILKLCDMISSHQDEIKFSS